MCAACSAHFIFDVIIVVFGEGQRCFYFGKGAGMQRVTKNSVGVGVVLVIPMLREKVLERHSSLRPSEKNFGTTFLHILLQKYP
jgi:hypothetical protein